MSWWDPRDWEGPGKQVFKVAKNIYKSTPFDNIYEGAKDASRGDWGGAFRQLAIGGLDTAMWMLPGGAALRGAGGIAKLGRGAAARTFLKGATSPSLAYKSAGAGLAKRGVAGVASVAGPSPFYELGRLLPGVEKNIYNPLEKFISDKTSPIVRPVVEKAFNLPVIGGLLTSSVSEGTPSRYNYTSTATGSTPSSGGYGSSAAELRRKEQDDLLAWKQSQAYGSSAAELRRKEEDDKRKAAEGAYDSGIAAAERNNIPPIVLGQQQTAGAAGGLGAAPGGLAGLSPDQTYQFAMEERLLQKQYDELLNQLNLDEKQATADTATARYGIQREAATGGQDLATQLAAAGLDFSPASAIGAEQLVQGGRAQQEAAATKNLANLIADFQKQKTQAKGNMDISKLLSQINRGRQQISNTIGNVGNQYVMAEPR